MREEERHRDRYGPRLKPTLYVRAGAATDFKKEEEMLLKNRNAMIYGERAIGITAQIEKLLVTR